VTAHVAQCWCRYLNASGLIWENAPAFGALIVFAEHRYYGVSKPFKKTLKEHMQFLTSEQAMADYAELLTELKHDLGAENSAVIGFGGSYGALPPQAQSLPARCPSNDVNVSAPDAASLVVQAILKHEWCVAPH